MTRLTFYYFMEYEDGKMAHMTTTEDMGIPVNIFIDNADQFEGVQRGECFMNVCAVCPWIKIYATEEEYEAADGKMTIPAMIPIGTFPIDPDKKDFEESPHILFTGKVLDFMWNPDAAEGDVNCCILIETLELKIYLYLEYDAPIEKGYIVYGVAWLFGDMHMDV